MHFEGALKDVKVLPYKLGGKGHQKGKSIRKTHGLKGHGMIKIDK